MRPFLTSILMIFAGLVLAMTSGCAVTKSQTKADDSGTDVAATVSYCELVRNADRFHEKVVRVKGIYERGFERSYFYDPECKNSRPEMWRNHDKSWVSQHKSFVVEGDSEEARQNRMISGFGRWSVTVVGRFLRAQGPVRFGHMGCCRFEIGLVKIEKSEKLPDN